MSSVIYTALIGCVLWYQAVPVFSCEVVGHLATESVGWARATNAHPSRPVFSVNRSTVAAPLRRAFAGHAAQPSLVPRPGLTQGEDRNDQRMLAAVPHKRPALMLKRSCNFDGRSCRASAMIRLRSSQRGEKARGSGILRSEAHLGIGFPCRSPDERQEPSPRPTANAANSNDNGDCSLQSPTGRYSARPAQAL